MKIITSFGKVFNKDHIQIDKFTSYTMSISKELPVSHKTTSKIDKNKVEEIVEVEIDAKSILNDTCTLTGIPNEENANFSIIPKYNKKEFDVYKNKESDNTGLVSIPSGIELYY